MAQSAGCTSHTRAPVTSACAARNSRTWSLTELRRAARNMLRVVSGFFRAMDASTSADEISVVLPSAFHDVERHRARIQQVSAYREIGEVA